MPAEEARNDFAESRKFYSEHNSGYPDHPFRHAIPAADYSIYIRTTALASKQVKSLTAVSSRLNFIYKDSLTLIRRSSLSLSILSTTLPSCAYSFTSNSRPSQQGHIHTTLTRLQDITLLRPPSISLYSHHYKMTFFGKNTIVRKVVASIKKEVSFRYIIHHGSNQLTRTTAYPLRDTPDQREGDVAIACGKSTAKDKWRSHIYRR